MNDLKNNLIFQACLMGILCGGGFGLFYSIADGGGWHRAVVNGLPFGLAMTLFTVVRSYNLSRWLWVSVLVICFGIRFYLGKLFGM